MISDRTKQLVDKYIQEGMNSPVRGWSMSEILDKIKKVKGSVSQAREYIIDKYYEWEEMN